MSLKVAAVQMTSGPSKDENVAAAVAMIEEAAGQGADLVSRCRSTSRIWGPRSGTARSPRRSTERR